MDSDEHKKAISIIVGIVLLLISIGFIIGLVVWAIGKANDQTDTLKASLTATETREFDMYNGTTVKGSSVLAAIKQYQGRGFAIVVNNTESNNAGGCNGTLDDPDKGSNPTAYLTKPSSLDYDSDNGVYTAEAGTGTEHTNIRYAQEKGDTAYIPGSSDYYSTLIMSPDNSSVVGIVFDKKKAKTN